ncbi:VWA domain-containing protein [Phaeobacter sp. 22II1-1F12B]|uniref:vWA domain-containing protein n=1 Tax=Phaeobacter sp. 22II1-1F12B TaxID=1317111 RepID=UPI000B522924|nr:VWA domain-containing protein [Phaeobacter sp. 22II1-1F12B]OWU73828.1 carbon monoxide dehydrogenase [Phaeobacter sp. 22II1-1F12B]
MSRVTRFAGRDPGPVARVGGFIAHLRENGLRFGVAEAELALTALTHVRAAHADENRLALKAVCTGCKDEAERFDDLFDAYWLNGGRVKRKVTPTLSRRMNRDVHSSRPAATGSSAGSGTPDAPGDQGGETAGQGTGKLIASDVTNRMRKDLRELVTPAEIEEATHVAERLGAAMRDRRSRRRKAAQRGSWLHFRKLIRLSLATGGEPVVLPRKARPDRSRRIIALCDVSGSMSVYSKVYLAFLAGLMRADARADAYLFHTRLVRITEALRDKDALRALARMSLMADGFAGGSRIGASVADFAKGPARRIVDGRTVVLILSDGYDTEPPEILSEALARLRKRGSSVIWLNPLKGWESYAPTAQSMRAALPYLDLFRAANTLADLAKLEGDLARI